MGLELINKDLIKVPTGAFISAMIKKEVAPELYAEWLLLFDAYNKANPKQTKGMGCFPCYGKVYQWYTQELKKQADEQGGH
jgi:hypothetical protein